MASNRATKSGFAAEAQKKGFDGKFGFGLDRKRMTLSSRAPWSECSGVADPQPPGEDSSGQTIKIENTKTEMSEIDRVMMKLKRIDAGSQVNAKYSEALAQECLEWIAQITNEDINTAGDMDNFYETLRDGTLLCRLVNSIEAGSVKKINEGKLAFKCMENINNFLETARKMGVPQQETFQTVDLWERQNLNSVVTCLQSLGRKMGKYGKPTIGPKEAEKNERHFTEEKLKAGNAIISLQYGSNKGANQSGINFGNTRHI